MHVEQTERALRQTLEDQRLSRSERRALRALFAGAGAGDLARYRNLAFKIAKAELGEDKRLRNVLSWLEDVTKVLSPRQDDDAKARAYFSPGEGPLHTIVGLLSSASATVDICVFTITDDRISKAISKAHRRGIKIRIISDNDKAYDRGSDIDRLEKQGVAVRVDRSEHHMHHKYALFDRELLLTGSYNWTRSACAHNHENVIVTSTANLVGAFCDNFEALWRRLG